MYRRSVRTGLYVASSILALTATPARAQIETVVVTAERREQDINKVPESISAFPKDKLDVLGVKNIGQLVKYTPGVAFDDSTNEVSIRGVNSDAGSGTTGIYIDDTPIQMRNLGFSSNDALPAVFDLDRIEILRGPQGTLFGAGSEGGTVRYITPQPSLTEFSLYSRAEGSFTQDGAPNFEMGLGTGGPLSDTVGFRISAWGRREGGVVDHVDYKTLAMLGENDNSNNTYIAHLALAWQPNPDLTITPSFYFQSRDVQNDNDYWVSISNPANGQFLTGTPEQLADRDQFYLPSLKIDYNAGDTELIFNASYFTRHELVNGYSGTLYNLSYFQQLVDFGVDPNGDPCPGGLCFAYAGPPAPPLLDPTGLNLPGYTQNYVSVANITNRQRNFTAEARLQSTDSDAPLVWVVGVFFEEGRQQSIEEINDPQLPALTDYLWGEDMATAWGMDLLPNGDDYINNTVGRDRQIALFGNATYAITDTLKLQAGVRIAWTHFSFVNSADGPQNFGASGGSGSSDESPVTPMVGLTWHVTPDNMLYATYARGYRIGGANAPTPPSCDADLADLGLAAAPTSYKSDTVDSYEIGTKNSFLEHRLQVSASAFHLNWDNIQQNNYLPNCGIQYTGNLGQAESDGFDLQANVLVSDNFELEGSVGYVDARYTATTFAGPAPGPGVLPLSVKGEPLPGPGWNFSAGAQYNTMAWGNNAYVRVDYEFIGRSYGSGGSTYAGTAAFDPALVPDPSYGQLSIRAAIQLGDVNLALFGENLFNAHPQLGLNHQDADTLLFEASTIRPRTIGLTGTYKF
jgi:outer membrane receptor protein involved in Fe transport